MTVDVEVLLHRDAHGVLADRLHNLLRHRYRISQGGDLLELGHQGDALLGLLARALLQLGAVDGVVDGVLDGAVDGVPDGVIDGVPDGVGGLDLAPWIT